MTLLIFDRPPPPSRSSRYLPLLLSLLLSFATAPYASAGGFLGLSSVRSTSFVNEDLLFFDPQAGDRFAWSLAVGDFNGDNADDLATGLPFDDGIAGFEVSDGGAVTVRYGGLGSGLGGEVLVLSQFSAGSPDPDEANDQFGWALAAGDFNGDGEEDLAVGVPGNAGGGDPPIRGAVAIHYGFTSGIELDAEQFLERGRNGIPLDYGMFGFGRTLAAGDFDGDGRQDLAIGTPDDGVSSVGPYATSGGAVTVLHGGIGGLLPYFGYRIDQGHAAIADVPEDFDLFGRALATGDFNNDSYDDLAIGVPGEDEHAGAVEILFGNAAGLLFDSSVIYRQAQAGGGATTETGDDFGAALAAGDFDGDGFDDLAIGAPLEDEGSLPLGAADTGAITILYGSAAGFNLARSDYFQQSDVYGVGAADQAGDFFGTALAAGDFDGDGHGDLAVGHPGESADGSDRGATTVLLGAAGGFLARYGVLHAGVAGVAGAPQDSQDFGRTLASGDFDGDLFADLVVGVPYFNLPALNDVGAEIVLYGALFADGFEGASSAAWSSSTP